MKKRRTQSRKRRDVKTFSKSRTKITRHISRKPAKTKTKKTTKTKRPKNKSTVKPRKRAKRINRRAMMKNIAPFVNFNYSKKKRLNQAQKNQISAASARIQEAQQNGAIPFVVKSKKKRLKAVQTFAPWDSDLVDDLKVVFIPAGYAYGKKLKFTKKLKPQLKDAHTVDEFTLFDESKLVKDADGYLTKLTSDLPDNQFYSVVTANGDIQGGKALFSRNQLILKIKALMAQYGGDKMTGKDGKPLNHNFKNWLVGIRATEFTNQDSPFEALDDDSE